LTARFSSHFIAMAPSPWSLCPRWLLLLSAVLGAPASAMSLNAPRQADARSAAGESPGRNSSIRVLVFLAAGSTPRTMETTKHNIDNLKSHSLIESEVYLAHYDGHKDKWQQSEGEWYSTNVNYSVEDQGGKFLMAQRQLPELLAKQRYDWIWLVDEDVDFANTNITRMFLDAGQTEAYIVQPALISGPKIDVPFRHMKAKAALLSLDSTVNVGCQPGEPMCDHLAPNRKCLFRYVNLVEVMTPIIRQDALLSILTACPGCIHERSVWGLDKMWCAWIAAQYNKLDTTGCAVLDRVGVVHMNQRTITKWDEHGNRRFDVIHRDYWGALNDVRDHYGKFFINDLGHTLRCVPHQTFQST